LSKALHRPSCSDNSQQCSSAMSRAARRYNTIREVADPLGSRVHD
jgi:hypothetical protein